MNHIKILFSEKNQAQREELIARLSVLEILGFEETTDHLAAYCEEDHLDLEAIRDIAWGVPFVTEILPHRNWNEDWESNFEPVIIDGFCSVRADFHPQPKNVTHDIVITPKMSFGTGHHATTALMIRLMHHINFKQKTVFDFGSGTGILAILAEKLGAASVLAIDNDEWAYLNALENCSRNHTKQVTVQQGTADDLPEIRLFDVILANINRSILETYMMKMSRLLKPGGTLLLSGILEEDITRIRSCAEESGLIPRQVITEQKWVGIAFDPR